MTLQDLVGIILRAAGQEHGLLLRVSDPERAKRAFARAKEDHVSSDETGEAMLPPVRFKEISGHPEGNLVILRAEGAREGEEE